MGFDAVSCATSFALVLYFCGPRPGSGHSLTQPFNDHHCVVDARFLGTVQAAFNDVSDIYLLCIPMPIISHRQLPRIRRNGVIAIFMTGSLLVKLLR